MQPRGFAVLSLRSGNNGIAGGPCIEAALQITGDNRATAAEMLGLSRQSLYAKLRRYGLGDLAAEE